MQNVKRTTIFQAVQWTGQNDREVKELLLTIYIESGLSIKREALPPEFAIKGMPADRLSIFQLHAAAPQNLYPGDWLVIERGRAKAYPKTDFEQNFEIVND